MSENSLSLPITDGEIAFSNSDNLEWNQKKHDIMLNLGLTNHSSEADQTPTPTRFIRNCEEVGLFQDLQNVNPFDEVFKKAVENPTPISLKVPVSSSDDTLHTPQIYPHLEETSKFTSMTTTGTSNEYSLNPLIIDLGPESDEEACKHSESSSVDTSPKNITSKEALKHQVKQKVIAAITQKTSIGPRIGLTPIPLDKLMERKEEKPKTVQDDFNVDELVRQREANKAAQSRCRKRKQREFEQMNSEITNLKRENLRLKGMNLFLQGTVKKLEAELKSTKSTCSLEHNTQDHSLPASILPSATLPIVSQGQPTENRQMEPRMELNKLPSIAPKPIVVAAPNSLPVSMQNIQNNSNNTVVVLCPRYMPTQSIIIPPTPILTQSVGLGRKSKAKCNYKKIVPKFENK